MGVEYKNDRWRAYFLNKQTTVIHLIRARGFVFTEPEM